MFAVLTLGFTFVACGDDDDDEVINYSTTAEQASAGTYSGTWTRIVEGTENTETGSGTITFSAGSATGVSNVNFECSAFSLSASSPANIWNSNYGFQFVQQVSENNPANVLGVAFAGEITKEGVLTTGFTISVKSGRTTTKYNYSFVGNK